MKKLNLLIGVCAFMSVLISCEPGTNKNAEDYGSRPEKKTSPLPALADIAAPGQKVPVATAAAQPEPAKAGAVTKDTKEVKAEPKAQGIDGQALLGKSDCLACHQLHTKVIGPAYDKVAMKYEPTEANIKMLSEKVIKGGSGVWGTLPMTPHPTLKPEEVTAMVKYILSVKPE